MLSLYMYLSSMQRCIENWNSHYCIPYFVNHGFHEISSDLSITDFASQLNQTGSCYDIRKAAQQLTDNALNDYLVYATESNDLAFYKNSLESIGSLVSIATDRITAVCSTITQSSMRQACLSEAMRTNLALSVCEHPPLFTPPDSSASSAHSINWLHVALPLMATAYLLYSANSCSTEPGITNSRNRAKAPRLNS